MYIGRIVSVGLTTDNRLCAAYRVSSRSFPNRTAVVGEDKVSIVPKAGHEKDVQRNPYIAYNCLRLVCDSAVAVVTNGSQTDPITEKIAMGVPCRDAMGQSLLTLDFEKDDYNTPRIASVVDKRDRSAWLGVVREDGLEVRRMPLEPGRCFYVATYEENSISEAYSDEFPVRNAGETCRYFLRQGIFSERTNPVTAVAALATEPGFEIAVEDAV